MSQAAYVPLPDHGGAHRLFRHCLPFPEVSSNPHPLPGRPLMATPYPPRPLVNNDRPATGPRYSGL